MIISVSISAIQREIYALSALRATQSPDATRERPRLLTADQKAALNIVITDSLTYLSTGMSPWLSGVTLDAMESPELIRFEFNVQPDSEADVCLVRRCIEHAAVHDALALVWLADDAPASETHSKRVDESMKQLFSVLRRLSLNDCRITPCRF